MHRVVDSFIDVGLDHCVYFFKDVVFGEITAVVGEALGGQIRQIDPSVLLLGLDKFVCLNGNRFELGLRNCLLSLGCHVGLLI